MKELTRDETLAGLDEMTEAILRVIEPWPLHIGHGALLRVMLMTNVAASNGGRDEMMERLEQFVDRAMLIITDDWDVLVEDANSRMAVITRKTGEHHDS